MGTVPIHLKPFGGDVLISPMSIRSLWERAAPSISSGRNEGSGDAGALVVELTEFELYVHKSYMS